jgi:hypothetical protein
MEEKMSIQQLNQSRESALKIMISVWLNNFQLNDTLQLLEVLDDQSKHALFVFEVQSYVDGFERSFSPDSLYPKRVGRWIGLNAPESVINDLMRWAEDAQSDGPCGRYRLEFRDALGTARKIDRSTRPKSFQQDQLYTL